MSRDTGERDAELVTAYLDGVAELSAEQRRCIEARLSRDPRARADAAAVRSLLAQLRALPPEGSEPDWAAMERSIHHAVHHAAHDAVGRGATRPWWRSWKWLAPTTTLATAMIVLLVMWARPPAIVPPPDLAGIAHPAPVRDEVVPLWLDGAEVDVDLSASDMLGEAVPGDDEPAMPDAAGDGDPGLLPSTDLAWVDRLDDDALASAEHWLAGASPAPTSPTSPNPRSPSPSPRKKT